MNLLTSNLQCIECGCTKLVKDYTRREVYCKQCGLVLVDTSLPTIALLEKSPKEDDFTKEDSYKLKRFFYNFKLAYDNPIWHNQK